MVEGFIGKVRFLNLILFKGYEIEADLTKNIQHVSDTPRIKRGKKGTGIRQMLKYWWYVQTMSSVFTIIKSLMLEKIIKSNISINTNMSTKQ